MDSLTPHGSFFQKRKPLCFTIREISFRTQTGEASYTSDVAGAFRDTDRFSCIQKIKKMRGLDAVVIGRHCEPLINQSSAFGFEHPEGLHEHRDIRGLKIIPGELNLIFMMDLMIRH